MTRCLARATVFVERRDLLAERRDARVRGGLACARGLEALAQIGQARVVGRGELLRFGVEALAPRLELAALLLDVAAFGGQHLDLLLHLPTAPRCSPTSACAARNASSSSGSAAPDVSTCRTVSAACVSATAVWPAIDSSSACASSLPLGPLRGLLLQLGKPLLDALAAFDHVADALLEPAHFERGFGQRALRWCSSSPAA